MTRYTINRRAVLARLNESSYSSSSQYYSTDIRQENINTKAPNTVNVYKDTTQRQT